MIESNTKCSYQINSLVEPWILSISSFALVSVERIVVDAGSKARQLAADIENMASIQVNFGLILIIGYQFNM